MTKRSHMGTVRQRHRERRIAEEFGAGELSSVFRRKLLAAAGIASGGYLAMRKEGLSLAELRPHWRRAHG